MTAITSNMTWAQIRQQFIRACGQSETASQEAWMHVNEGYRQVLREGDCPEVYREELRMTVPLDPEHPGEFLDYVELPCDYMTIYSVFNEEVGAPCNWEPSGWRGRDRFLDAAEPKDTRAKPPGGEVRWFVPMGRRIYLRDTPDRDTTLRVSYRIQPPLIDDGYANEHPLTPQQFDWSIIWFAAANYYKNHVQLENASEMSQRMEQNAATRLHGPKNPDAEVEKTAFHRMRVAGYRWTPRSRRRARR